MSIKLLVSDMDGTLLNEKHKISSRTVRALRCAMAAGIRMVAATGRAWSSASPLLEEAGVFCDAILLNGAEFRRSDGNIIFRESMETGTARAILQMLSEEHADVEINTNIGDFSTNVEFCSQDRPMPEMAWLWDRNPKIQKIFIFSREHADLIRIWDKLERFEGISRTTSLAWNIEVTSDKADKGKMLKRVLRYYAITDKEVAVFGDGANDRGMLEGFDYSCAMGNSPEAVKGYAKKVIGACTEDGVAVEIEHILKRQMGIQNGCL